MKTYTFEERLRAAWLVCGCDASHYQTQWKRVYSSGMAARLALYIDNYDRGAGRVRSEYLDQSVSAVLSRLGIKRQRFYMRAIPPSQKCHGISGYIEILSRSYLVTRYRAALEGKNVIPETEDAIKCEHMRIDEETWKLWAKGARTQGNRRKLKSLSLVCQ